MIEIIQKSMETIVLYQSHRKIKLQGFTNKGWFPRCKTNITKKEVAEY